MIGGKLSAIRITFSNFVVSGSFGKEGECVMHYCMRCGLPCDCWAFAQTHGDVCDGCSDCACNEAGVGEQPQENNVDDDKKYETEKSILYDESCDAEVTWGGYPLTWGDEG